MIDLTGFDRAMNGDNDQRSTWLLDHEEELREMFELLAASSCERAAPKESQKEKI